MAKATDSTISSSVDEDKALGQKQGAARTAASRRLREEYPDRWHALLGEEYTNQGLTYVRRATPEERAAEQIEALLAEHPNLRGKVGVGEGAVPTAFPTADDGTDGGAI